jgi:Arc/MetJ family transcription regulator
MYVRIGFLDEKPMRTTIEIDDALMRKALRLSGLTTKKAVVEAALRLLIRAYSHASPLDVKGLKLGVSTAGLVAIVRKGRERG